MSTLAVSVARPRLAVDRRLLAPATFVALGLVDIFVFGLFAAQGDARFQLSLADAKVSVPTVAVPAAATAYALGALTIVLGLLWATVELGKTVRRLFIAVALLGFIFSLLCWADAGKAIPLNLIALSESTLNESTPIVLGALAGLLCERSGVINIAIEGQFLLGSFTAAVVTSVTGGLYLGLVTGSLAGGLLGALLAVFAIRYFVDQIVVGVIINVFALGLTGYLYDRVLIPYQNTLNSPATFAPIKIPVLGDIPIIGPIFFDETIFLYIVYVALILVHVGMFHTRWGLRVRAVGEHPTAADTVGIRVFLNRYRNVILGGLLAGIGGAYFTIGSVGAFAKNISSGRGYIALAAMIFGRWRPMGALGAALVFGFADALQIYLSTLNVPIPSFFLLMAPYIATIIVVAGLVGKTRPPKADGVPYIKS